MTSLSKSQRRRLRRKRAKERQRLAAESHAAQVAQVQEPQAPPEPHVIFPYSEPSTAFYKGERLEYRHWQFTDHRRSIRYEGLVGGTDDICDALALQWQDGEHGFRLEFLDRPFPGMQFSAIRIEESQRQWAGTAGRGGLASTVEPKGGGWADANDPIIGGVNDPLWLGHMPASAVPIVGGNGSSSSSAGGTRESGNVYRFRYKGHIIDGWLCPRLFAYFDKAPAVLYAAAHPLTDLQQMAVRLAA